LTYSGDSISNENYAKFISLVTLSPEIQQQYIIHKLFESLKVYYTCDRTLIKASVWIIGEYGDLLLDNAGGKLPDVTEEEVFKSLTAIMESHYLNEEAEAILITSLGKLTTRLPNMGDKIINYLKRYSTSISEEVQERTCEYLTILLKFDQSLKEEVFKKMPTFEIDDEIDIDGEEIEKKLNQNNDEKINDSDEEKGEEKGEEVIEKKLNLINILDDSEKPKNESQKKNDILSMLFGGDEEKKEEVKESKKEEKKETKKEEKFSLENFLTLDEGEKKSSVLNIMNIFGEESTTENTTNTNKSQSFKFKVFDRDGLVIDFRMSNSNTPNTYFITAIFSNSNYETFTNFEFLAAVPPVLFFF
jgi:hypothetical protein